MIWVAGFVVGLSPDCGVAQTLPAQGERYRIEVAGNVVTLTDLSAVAVTGFRGTYDCGSAGKPSSVVEDSVILGMGTTEVPKSSLAFQAPSGECTGGVGVIAFADGQHVGGADAWKQVVTQRSAAYAEVSGLLALAEGVPAKDWKLADFVGQMEKLRSALRASQNMGADERRGRLMVLESCDERAALRGEEGGCEDSGCIADVDGDDADSVDECAGWSAKEGSGGDAVWVGEGAGLEWFLAGLRHDDQSHRAL